jgi:hypothetical protein
MTSQDNKYELSPMGKKLPEAGKYPKLRPEQLGAILDRKENSVNSRYIAADITDKAILKFYAQLREPQPFKQVSNASLTAQEVFAAKEAAPLAPQEVVAAPVIDMQAWKAEREAAQTQPIPPQTELRPTAQIEDRKEASQPAEVTSGPDGKAVRIDEARRKLGIVFDGDPHDVAQQFEPRSSEAA